MMAFNKNEKIVVVDSGMTDLLDNKLFVPELAAKISHTILPLCFLYQEALKNGIRLITPDVYFALLVKPNNVLMITHLETKDTKKLIKAGVKPIIVSCQESPVVAVSFYARLNNYTKKFKHSFVFSGMKKKISQKSVYHQMYFPQPYSINDFKPNNFQDKKLVTLVVGAKFSGSRKKILLINFLYSIKRLLPKEMLAIIFGARSMSAWNNILLIRFFYGSGVKDIFFERRRAITFFSKKKCLDLYGLGWDKINFKDPNYLDIKQVYQGTIDNKLETLRNYKFTLCFENAVFPGYITEKIFDAIFAGSVPIYYGAPDIKDYVPEECFIDFREFVNYDELYKYISEISESEYSKYLEAMKKFIQSEKYYKFSQECYAKTFLSIFNNEFNDLCQK